MRNIQVNSLPVLEVIEDLATAFETDYKQNICEYILTIPPHIGSGFIKAYQLDNGIGIIQYDCVFNEDLEIQFVVNNVHPIKFMYVVKGNLQHRFENDTEIHILNEYQSAIVASRSKYGHILNFKANTSVAKFSIEINRKTFQLKEVYNNEEVDDSLYKLFSDSKGNESFYYRGNYSLNIADVFSNLKAYDTNFEGDKLVYKFYMESVAYKSLVLHLTQFLDDRIGDNGQKILRKREFEQIKKGVNYINNNLETYKGLDELICETGLNPIKLQSGFKYLYNITVNQYVQEKRLEEARHLLINTDHSISQIVSAIGLKSASYFSRIFKEKYGIQPSLFNRNK